MENIRIPVSTQQITVAHKPKVSVMHNPFKRTTLWLRRQPYFE